MQPLGRGSSYINGMCILPPLPPYGYIIDCEPRVLTRILVHLVGNCSQKWLDKHYKDKYILELIKTFKTQVQAFI